MNMLINNNIGYNIDLLSGVQYRMKRFVNASVGYKAWIFKGK